MAQELTSKQKAIRILIPSLIVIGATAYLIAPASSSVPADQAKFAYCRHCDKEVRHQPGHDLPNCLYCRRETVGLAESVKKTGKPKNPYFRTFMVCYCEVIVTLAMLYYFTKPSRKSGEAREPQLVMHCPECRRKLKYRQSQQGSLGQCPICKKPLKFPVRSDKVAV